MKCGASLSSGSQRFSESRTDTAAARTRAPSLLEVEASRTEDTGSDSSKVDGISQHLETIPGEAGDSQSEATAAGLEAVSWGSESSLDGLESNANSWREELSTRLDKLRERRARSREPFDPRTSLDLDFDHAGERKGGSSALGSVEILADA
jgi:hypothetical protein